GADAARDSFERALRADADSPEIYAGMAEAQWLKYAQTLDKRWIERAEASVRDAQARNPDVASVHRILGLIRFEYGSYEQAINAYRRAIELDPRNSDAYRRMGQAFERNGQLDDGLAAFRKAVAVEPGYFRNYQSLGTHFITRGNSREAAEQYRKGVAL